MIAQYSAYVNIYDKITVTTLDRHQFSLQPEMSGQLLAG